jgi:hypothetical protein
MRIDKPRLSFGSFRSWHLWLSIALSLPILIVALTAIFIAHDKDLGLKETRVNAGWLPGMEAGGGRGLESRALWTSAAGESWLGTRQGLYRVSDGRARRVEDLGYADVRALQPQGEALIAATPRGLYRVEASTGRAERVAKGDFWSLSSDAQGLTAVGKSGLFLRSQGGDWQPYAPGTAAGEAVAATLVSADDAGQVPLSRVIMDLHTGKAFFGKTYEWIWIDLIGATMALLTITGLVMWWRGQRRKVAALEAQLAAALQAQPPHPQAA